MLLYSFKQVHCNLYTQSPEGGRLVSLCATGRVLPCTPVDVSVK